MISTRALSTINLKKVNLFGLGFLTVAWFQEAGEVGGKCPKHINDKEMKFGGVVENH